MNWDDVEDAGHNFMVTLVYPGRDGRQVIKTHHGRFRISDPALIECALDAAWTAFYDGRTTEGESALSEVLEASNAVWWLMFLPQCTSPPKIGC